jgi:FkbM family methyltransferase
MKLGRFARSILPGFDLYRQMRVLLGRSTKIPIMGKTLRADLDSGFAGTLYQEGVWEPHETAFLLGSLKEGMVFVDIGANIGYYTILASELVGRSGKVFAFEPDDRNFSLLEQNINENKCGNVVAIRKAVSDTTGRLRLYPSKSNFGDHRTYAAWGEASPPSRLIEATALDDFFSSGARIDFVKVDIQGAEYVAFAGMKRVLQENHDIILLLEFTPVLLSEAGASPLQFLQELRHSGFVIYTLLEHKPREASDAEILNIHTGREFNLVISRKPLSGTC